MKTTEERIKYLEIRLRRYQGLTMVLGLVVVALVTISAKPTIPDVIRARRFEVVNPQGKGVATLRSWELGGLLIIGNTDDNITTYIGQNYEGGGRLVINSAEGNKIFEATENEAGDGLLKIYSKEGKQRISLGSLTETGGFVKVNNKTGETVVTLSVDEYGNGAVGAWNRKGEGRTLQPGP